MSNKRGHEWFARRRLPWLTYCAKCGLVWLKNAASRKAVSGPCEGDKYTDRCDDTDHRRGMK